MNVPLTATIIRTHIETIIYGIPLLLIAGLAAAVVWALVKPLFHRRDVRRGKAEHHRATHDGAGDRLPPVARGICQSCQQYSATVYYLPNGEKYCRDCYKPDKGAKR
jgi:hypothetical protein